MLLKIEKSWILFIHIYEINGGRNVYVPDFLRFVSDVDWKQVVAEVMLLLDDINIFTMLWRPGFDPIPSPLSHVEIFGE